MLYMKSDDGSRKVLIFETANLEELKKGRPAMTPDGSVTVVWTPDIQWLAEQIRKTSGDGPEIAELIQESLKRPEKPTAPYHEPEVHDFRK